MVIRYLEIRIKEYKLTVLFLFDRIKNANWDEVFEFMENHKSSAPAYQKYVKRLNLEKERGVEFLFFSSAFFLLSHFSAVSTLPNACS